MEYTNENKKTSKKNQHLMHDDDPSIRSIALNIHNDIKKYGVTLVTPPGGTSTRWDLNNNRCKMGSMQ